MSLSIAIYSNDSFKEFILPSINNSDYELFIRKDQMKTQGDLRLVMEVVNNTWTVKSDKDYRLFVKDNRYDSVDLMDGLIANVVTKDNDNLTIISTEVENPFHAYDKYRISNQASITIGKDASNDISCDYLGVSREHATILHDGGRAYIDCTGKNGLYINSVRVDGRCELHFGDYINVIGLHMMYLGSLLAIDMAGKGVSVSSSKLKRINPGERGSETRGEKAQSPGKTVFRRSPRYVEGVGDSEIEIEAPPALPEEKQQSLFMSIGPSITMALPMLLGCMLMIFSLGGKNDAFGGAGSSTLLMYLGLAIAVLSALAGVIWTGINRKKQKADMARMKDLRLSKYGEYLDKKSDEIKKAYEHAITSLNDNYPDASVCVSYDENSADLWDRNISHEDFLVHRLGKGNIPFEMDIDVPRQRFSLYDDDLAERPQTIKDNYSMLYDVPVTVDIYQQNVIGIIGDDGKKNALQIARILSTQIAASNCYTDVKLAYIYDENNTVEAGEWEFAKWLPHVWAEDKKARYIASNTDEKADVLYELGNIFRIRAENEESGTIRQNEIPRPYYVLFVSDASLIEGEMFSKYIYDKDNRYGLTTIILAEQYEELPNKCEFIIENTARFRGCYETSSGRDSSIAIDFDRVGSAELEDFSRRLSKLRVLEEESGGEIPSSLTFFEMQGVKRPEELPVKELWTKSRIYENIKGLIGQKAGGVPVYLDAHEKYHGPHGLVAGTTGSGKSETLQTYILSLAVNYSPDDIEFFIIDYKGGGMANLFDGLPHMAGQISNLSGNQVRRAMISIKSENRRRQRIFSENGVNNINSYTKLYKSGEVTEPVPHLFIVIDEFAELKREEPEFMQELISVAQVGRSLGVHLILATQKPSGTVDDNIWSNSRFRLCLRVQDKQDSSDILHKPDAAYITQAGRGYLQVGNDELYELFQSGYSGAVYDEDSYTSNTNAAELIALTGKVDMTGKIVRQGRKKQSKKKERTELDAVKDYLAQVSSEVGYEAKHQLWLPVLRDRIYLGEFSEYSAEAFSSKGEWKPVDKDLKLNAVVGQMDDPENQTQMPFVIDFAEAGNVAICGSIVSGKSTLMQTIAYSLIQQYSPETVNLYAIDFSSKVMSAFESAPHFGGIMYENDDDKIAKFFNMMDDILEERKKIFHGGNYREFVRVNGVTLPAIFILIDNYGAFKLKTEERYEEALLRLSKEGISNGIYLIASGGGFNSNEISSRIGENFSTVLTLALKDKFEYQELLHTMQIDVLPEQGIRGRGLAYYGTRILEYQAALALEADNDYERIERIKDVCRSMAESWQGKKAKRVPVIPDKPVWDEFVSLQEYEELSEDPTRLPVGYDAANASVYGIPLDDTFCYGIYGDMKSGKTNMLKACIQSALDKKADVYVFDSAEKALGVYEHFDGSTYCSSDKEIFDCFNALTPEFKKRSSRKAKLVSEGMEAEEIFKAMSEEFTPIFIFISELDQFINTIYKSEYDMKGFVENVFSKGQNNNIYFFADLSIRNKANAGGYPAFESFIGYRKGVHVGGKTVGNTILNFDYIPYNERGKAEWAGLATLPEVYDEKETSKVVIPLVKKTGKEEISK